MTAKCAICQEAPYSFLWQPTLGDDTLTEKNLQQAVADSSHAVRQVSRRL